VAPAQYRAELKILATGDDALRDKKTGGEVKIVTRSAHRHGK